MANGLTTTPGLSVPTGLSVSAGLATPGGGFSFGGFTNNIVILPGVGMAIWQGHTPRIAGGTLRLSVGLGAAVWTGFLPGVVIQSGGVIAPHPGVGLAIWTGYPPAVTGLISANAINWGAASTDFLSWGVSNELTWGA
jgi:hypothetical protein